MDFCEGIGKSVTEETVGEMEELPSSSMLVLAMKLGMIV